MNKLQKRLNIYKSKFNDLIKEIEKDKIIKSLEGNGVCAILEAMKEDIKHHLDLNRKKPN